MTPELTIRRCRVVRKFEQAAGEYRRALEELTSIRSDIIPADERDAWRIFCALEKARNNFYAAPENTQNFDNP